MKNSTIILFSLFLLASCVNSSSQQKGSIENVDAKRFKELAEAGNGIVLDVRTPEEVSEGYIANAVTYDIYKDDFEKNVSGLDKSKEVYVYCRAGRRSLDAAAILQKKGFTKIYNLTEGINEWNEAGYPLVK